MKCQIYIVVVSLFLLVNAEHPQYKYQQKPLMFKNWPPSKGSAMVRSNGMMLHLRGSGSSNVASRIPGPGMMIKAGTPIRFAIPMRPQKGNLAPSASNNVFYKAGYPQSSYKRPYAAHLTAQSPAAFKFSSPSQKTAIKLQLPPPLKNKPEYIYEKVHVPKYADPVRYNVGSDGAIHTIPAPNLGSKNHAQAPEINYNILNNQLDSDLAKFPAVFSLEKPGHQYQVKENTNDLSIKNQATGQQFYYAPDNDPSLKAHLIHPVDDPLSIPTNGVPKPSDVHLYQQNLEYEASPLVQGPQYALEPFGFPVTSQPQLQQYHLQQSAMLKQGMFPSLNPTYLVMQSNNLLGQHQQFQSPQLFRPEHGYIDTSVTAQPYSTYGYSQPQQQVASLGQIYQAQHQDQLHHGDISTQSPTTLSNFHHESSASEENPSFSQVYEPKPANYQYSQNQNFIDLPEEHLNQNDIQNLLYNDMYQDYLSNRQLQNDLVLREAQHELYEKQKVAKQQAQTAYDLHQLVQQEKYNPLRIVVPDEENQGFQKRADETVEYDDEYSDEHLSEEEKKTESKATKSS